MTVLITGAAGALGSVVARSLAQQAKVALLVRPQSQGALEVLVQELGGQGIALPCDAGSDTEVRAALTRATEALGPIDGGVLIAGGWAGGTPLHQETDETTWERMFQANVTTARICLRALLAGMVERRGGSVVLIGSRVVERPWEGAGASAYTASKAALTALAAAASAEVLDAGVRVNVILPSTVDTPANRAAMPDADPSRWVTREAIADVVEFLLSERARAISGAAIPVYAQS